MQGATRQIATASAPAALLGPAPCALAAWYAMPLDARDAGTLLEHAQAAIQQRLRSGDDRHSLQLLVLLCRFWTGADFRGDYLELAALPAGDDQRALLDLVYGQLLVSRKLNGATRYLAQGFARAAGLLAGGDYFQVLRRHELLAYLTLADRPAPARDLPELLAEAAVIRRLRGTGGMPATGTHLDTLG